MCLTYLRTHLEIYLTKISFQFQFNFRKLNMSKPCENLHNLFLATIVPKLDDSDLVENYLSWITVWLVGYSSRTSWKLGSWIYPISYPISNFTGYNWNTPCTKWRALGIKKPRRESQMPKEGEHKKWMGFQRHPGWYANKCLANCWLKKMRTNIILKGEGQRRIRACQQKKYVTNRAMRAKKALMNALKRYECARIEHIQFN